MKSSQNNQFKSSSGTARIEAELLALRVREDRGKLALKETLLALQPDSSSGSDIKKGWFYHLPAMATGLAALVLVVFGASWFLNNNSNQTNVVSTQTQANGTVQNAVNTQLQDAQDDGSIGNDDSTQINTANARLQSAVNVGNSINESQF